MRLGVDLSYLSWSLEASKITQASESQICLSRLRRKTDMMSGGCRLWCGVGGSCGCEVEVSRELVLHGPRRSVASAVVECHWSKGVEAVGREGRRARSEGSKGLAVLLSAGHVAAACCRLCGAAAAIAVVGRHWSKGVEACRYWHLSKLVLLVVAERSRERNKAIA